jgi:hypothetical protein
MAVPAAPGELHIRISSNDSLNRHSETQDIIVLIPEPATQIQTDGGAATTTDTESETLTTEEDAIAVQDDDEQNNVKPILEINGVEAPEKQSGGLSATNAILGGLALLLAGVLVGVLVKTGKKE